MRISRPVIEKEKRKAVRGNFPWHPLSQAFNCQGNCKIILRRMSDAGTPIHVKWRTSFTILNIGFGYTCSFIRFVRGSLVIPLFKGVCIGNLPRKANLSSFTSTLLLKGKKNDFFMNGWDLSKRRNEEVLGEKHYWVMRGKNRANKETQLVLLKSRPSHQSEWLRTLSKVINVMASACMRKPSNELVNFFVNSMLNYFMKYCMATKTFLVTLTTTYSNLP